MTDTTGATEELETLRAERLEMLEMQDQDQRLLGELEFQRDQLAAEVEKLRTEAEKWKDKSGQYAAEVEQLRTDLHRAHAYIGEQALKKH